MEGTRRIPADIFEEMGGVTDAPTPVSVDNSNDVNIPNKATPINRSRLKTSAKAFNEGIVKNYNKEFIKLYKEFRKILKPQKIRKSQEDFQQFYVINPEKKSSEEEKSSAWSPFKLIIKAFKFFAKVCKFVFKLAWRVLKVLYKIAKFVLKLAFKALKIILKILWKLLKMILKFLRPILKILLKLIWKCFLKLTKVVLRGIWALIKLFWKIVKYLFFKGKKIGKKLFRNEPKLANFAVKVFKIKNGITVKLKPLIKRTSFIMRFLKKAFRPMAKLFWNLIKKFFGEILKKLIKTVVSIIVNFVVGQILGSFLPGLGNILGAAWRNS